MSSEKEPHPSLTHARYVAGEVLGRGAQGTVLRVVDREAPERALVAKVWLPGRFPERALRGEFALLARLSVPGVVQAHDFGRDALSGAPFLIEDFVPGPDARSYVDQGAPEKRAERLAHVVRGVLRGLVGLHEAGFVHGDLKPAHAKVDARGHVTLIDLGSALERGAGGSNAGSPGYVAPELLGGATPSVRSDLYAAGALAFSIAFGEPPNAGAKASGPRARWLPPQLGAVIERLIAAHPQDRPANASEALALSTTDASVEATTCSVPPLGREREIRELTSRLRPGVSYLSGPSGIGKTHLAREVWIRGLLAGREARRVTFPCRDEAWLGRLIRFFHGDTAAWPFGAVARDAPLLLILDPLERAPSELAAALEAFRCRADFGALEVLGVTREAPRGASGLELGPLSDAEIEALARGIGRVRRADLAPTVAACHGNPGWLLALHGGAPLTLEMVLERVQGLDATTRELLASVALCGGEVHERRLEQLLDRGTSAAREALASGFDAGLLRRELDEDGARYRLTAPALSAELGAALATFEVVDRAASVLLRAEEATARELLAVAQAPCTPARREELLERAAVAARSTGLRSDEIDALLALLASAERRSVELLLRLERITRDAGAPAGHPEVLAWLEQAAQAAPALAPLVLRRRAERAARAGDAELAERLIADAAQRAIALEDRAGEGFVHGSAAAIALYRADWPRAELALALARERLHGQHGLDAEELARLEHNAGVVDLYAERFRLAAEKLERSLAIKRGLGDRAGVRSCLLNLGIASSAAGHFARAEGALVEALELARSLGQRAGEAWCLAARVDLEVRRGDPHAAERWLADADAAADAAPAMVRADLGLLHAQVALLRGDAARALERLSALDAQLIASDASLRAKALLFESEAWLQTLPAEPRRAARLALRSLRLARNAKLGELGERARSVFARARARKQRPRPSPPEPSYTSDVDSSPSAQERMPPACPREWDWLREVASGLERTDAIASLCRLFVSETRAERAWIAQVGADARVTFALGVDLDGFALSQPEARMDAAFLTALLASAGFIYQPEVSGGARLGARALVGDGERLVLLLEHRFRPAHFDALDSATLERWLTLARVAMRLGSSAAPRISTSPSAESADVTTTREPVRAHRRTFPEILGDSPALHHALARLDAAIDSQLPVLIQGETGSGKELFARALHERGRRRDRPFVAVNCAAIADTLFEAELFGHVRGAFTGADRVRPGLLAHAEGGTLLLDEIGELSSGRQATLLRLLETGHYRSVGSDLERRADVRIVAATNRDLASEVESGRFRRDLLFRLNVLEIRVPPLRERREDVPLLARAFLRRADRPREISEDACARLAGHSWPGNVRELENVIDRLLTADAGPIDVPDLPRAIRLASPYPLATVAHADPPSAAGIEAADAERREVEQALARAGGNITHAAEALGLTRHGLKKRMLRLGLRSRGTSRA